MASDPKLSGTPDTPAPEKGNGEDKGKGVAGDDHQEATKHADGDSVLSRLGQSAAALSRSVVQGTPSVNDLANAASSGKSGPSLSSTNLDTPIKSSSATAASSSSARTDMFRAEHAGAHVAAEEAAFSDFLDSTGVFIPAEPAGLDKAWEAATTTSTSPMSSSASRGMAESSVAEQQERDGVEVVRLLSQFDDERPDYEEQVNLSAAELKSLGQALFEDGSPAQTSASDWNNMLNFIPDFLRDQSDSHGMLRASEGSHMNLGVTDTTTAGQLWLDEWNRVLTSYNDEVWGDLGDLVQQARTEVERLRDNQERQAPDPTALRRLRTVLTRVRARL